MPTGHKKTLRGARSLIAVSASGLPIGSHFHGFTATQPIFAPGSHAFDGRDFTDWWHVVLRRRGRRVVGTR